MTQHNPEIIIPLIGNFSSGKSSLINALLGSNLLTTDITPETALPIELRAGAQSRFTACWPNGKCEALTEAQFLRADFGAIAAADGWIKAELPQLQAWPNLVLVDLPGWSSGESEHERHIDEYLQQLARTHLDKNTLFLVVVGADEGTLRDKVRERLVELDMGGSPYALVLTKADKRNQADLQAVSNHIEEVLTQMLGMAPQHVLHTSARKGQTAPLRQALDALQQALLQKKAPDTQALAGKIDRYIEQLAEVRDDFRDIAEDVFDDVWDKLDDRTFDENFDFVPYSSAKLRGKWLLDSLAELFLMYLQRHLTRRIPAIPQPVLDDLAALGLNAPQACSMGEADKLTRGAKEYVNKAIAKAEPGFFASSEPEAVGKRIISNLRSMRSQFRSLIVGVASYELKRWVEHETDGWRRLRKLVAS